MTSQEAALEAMIALVEQKAREVAELKRSTNLLCRQMKRPDAFVDVEEIASQGVQRVRPDQFYGKSPIVAAREYLEARHEAVQPEEILEALQRGGFDFGSQSWPEKDRQRLLAISLSKNSIIFHRLPNGTYGLLKWYPDKEKERGDGGNSAKRKQTKAPSKAKPKAKKAAKPAAPRQQKREAASTPAGFEVAVQKAIGELSGQFTMDDVLPKLDESDRDRSKVGAELNRLAQKGSGIRKVSKGGLNKPALYERAEGGRSE